MKTSVCFYLTSNKNFQALKAGNRCCSYQLQARHDLSSPSETAVAGPLVPEVFVQHLTPTGSQARQRTVATSPVHQWSSHSDVWQIKAPPVPYWSNKQRSHIHGREDSSVLVLDEQVYTLTPLQTGWSESLPAGFAVGRSQRMNLRNCSSSLRALSCWAQSHHTLICQGQWGECDLWVLQKAGATYPTGKFMPTCSVRMAIDSFGCIYTTSWRKWVKTEWCLHTRLNRRLWTWLYDIDHTTATHVSAR